MQPIESLCIRAPFFPPLNLFIPILHKSHLPGLLPPPPDLSDMAFEQVEDDSAPQMLNTLIIKSQMGTGKTTSFVNHINSFSGKCLVLANRRSILFSLLGKVDDMQLYANLSCKQLQAAQKLCITIESLHRLCGDRLELPLPTYDLIVIDELPATLMQLTSTTVKRRSLTMQVFQHLLYACGTLVACASDCGPEDCEFLLTLRPDRHALFVENLFAQNAERLLVYTNKNNFMEQLRICLKTQRRVYIAADELRWIKKMRQLVEELWPQARVQEYSSKTSHLAQHQDELLHPEIAWQNYDVVLTTPTITHGIDFCHSSHFSQQFYFATGRSIPPRCIIQCLRRVRTTALHLVHLYVVQHKTEKQPLTENNFDISQLKNLDWAKWKISPDTAQVMMNYSDPLTCLGVRFLNEAETKSHCQHHIMNGWKDTGGPVVMMDRCNAPLTHDMLNSQPSNEAISKSLSPPKPSMDCEGPPKQLSRSAHLPPSTAQPVKHAPISLEILSADECFSTFELFLSLVYDLGFVTILKKEWRISVLDSDYCSERQLDKACVLLAILLDTPEPQLKESFCALEKKTTIIGKLTAALKRQTVSQFGLTGYRIQRVARKYESRSKSFRSQYTLTLT